MLGFLMKPPGTFKLLGRARRKTSQDVMDPTSLCVDRSDRIVDSLRAEILEGDDDQSLRIRQVFKDPKEIFRVEIDRPEQNYQRTTLLDRDALEELLAFDEVRERVLQELD